MCSDSVETFARWSRCHFNFLKFRDTFWTTYGSLFRQTQAPCMHGQNPERHGARAMGKTIDHWSSPLQNTLGHIKGSVSVVPSAVESIHALNSTTSPSPLPRMSRPLLSTTRWVFCFCSSSNHASVPSSPYQRTPDQRSAGNWLYRPRRDAPSRHWAEFSQTPPHACWGLSCRVSRRWLFFSFVGNLAPKHATGMVNEKGQVGLA
jgi:hypothetical protein